jgi:hypothetical protein
MIALEQGQIIQASPKTIKRRIVKRCLRQCSGMTPVRTPSGRSYEKTLDLFRSDEFAVVGQSFSL